MSEIKYIEKKSVAPIDPVEGAVVDTLNVVDKVKNAPSINLVQQMTGIPQEGVIAFDGDVIPEGYEEVSYDGGIVTVNNDNGTAIKYPDGTMICTKRIMLTNVNVNQSVGSSFMSDVIDLGNFAESFKGTPIENITLIGGNMCYVSPASWYSNTLCGGVRFLRPTSSTVTEVHINIVAVGRWK